MLTANLAVIFPNSVFFESPLFITHQEQFPERLLLIDLCP